MPAPDVNGIAETDAVSAPRVEITYSVNCDDCGLVGAGLNEEQAKALRFRHACKHAEQYDGKDQP